MFNVIVSWDTTAWETDQLMRMRGDRFKEMSGGPEADRISLDDPASLRLIEGIPTLLFYEQCVTAPNVGIVRYGSVTEIRRDGGSVFFRFSEEGRFSGAVLAEFEGRLHISVNRTHWAVKEGGIPRAMMDRLIPSYDVVFSFAGADRSYVSRVARYLRTRRIKVFYDEYEQTDLWGRDLAEHFDTVYGQSGRYCVMFISADYVRSMWTRLERRTALARAIRERSEYILPARFDDTVVEGIRSTLAYIRLEDLTPAGFAKQVLRKLGRPVS